MKKLLLLIPLCLAIGAGMYFPAKMVPSSGGSSYTLVESFGASPDDGEFIATTTPRTYSAGSFVAGSSYTITRADVSISCPVGRTAGNFTLYIYSSAGGHPVNQLVASTPVTTAAASSGGFIFVPFILLSPLSLTSGTTYHIVLTCDTLDNVNQAEFSCLDGGGDLNISSDAISWSIDASAQITMNTYKTP